MQRLSFIKEAELEGRSSVGWRAYFVQISMNTDAMAELEEVIELEEVNEIEDFAKLDVEDGRFVIDFLLKVKFNNKSNAELDRILKKGGIEEVKRMWKGVYGVSEFTEAFTVILSNMVQQTIDAILRSRGYETDIEVPNPQPVVASPPRKRTTAHVWSSFKKRFPCELCEEKFFVRHKLTNHKKRDHMWGRGGPRRGGPRRGGPPRR